MKKSKFVKVRFFQLVQFLNTKASMMVLLFDYDNSYPWCKTGVDESHPLVTKVHNWEEVRGETSFMGRTYKLR
jgi:hypothetical protein